MAEVSKVEVHLRVFFKAPGPKGLHVTPCAKFLMYTRAVRDPRFLDTFEQAVHGLGEMVDMVRSSKKGPDGKLVQEPAELVEMNEQEIADLFEKEREQDLHPQGPQETPQ